MKGVFCSRNWDGSAGLPTVAVVIPAYCVARHIGAVLATIPGFVSRIIVVDDCSTDNTSELVRACGDPRVYLATSETNQGVGGAVLTGYDIAIEMGAEVIVKMDGDGQMDPAYLVPLITPIVLGEADYTKGNRFLHVHLLRTMSLLRRIGNVALSFLTKLASGYWNVFDPTNGYTAIHAALVPLLDREAIHRRYFFETSMLLELALLRAAVRDVYMPARYLDEVSSLSEGKALSEFPPRLLRGLLRRLTVLYLIRDFTFCSVSLLAGLLLTASGVAFGAYHWYLSAATNVQATTGTVMLAVVPVIVGIQFLLQAVSSDIQNMPVTPIHRGLILGRSFEALASGDGVPSAKPSHVVVQQAMGTHDQ